MKKKTLRLDRGDKVPLEKPIIYFNLDESGVMVKEKGKGLKIRGRVVSAYTGRYWGKKKRWELNNKRIFVELYRPGDDVDTPEYTERLMKWLGKNYDLKEGVREFGATDGAPVLKKIVSLINNNVPVASKFHASRNEFYKAYMEGIREGVNNWKDPDCLGYSAEGDIFRVLKSRLDAGSFNLRRAVSIFRSYRWRITRKSWWISNVS